MRIYFEVFLFLAVIHSQLDLTYCEDQLNNGTLEENCFYRCKNSTCITEELLCNGRLDCQNADDEEGCIKLEIKSMSTDQFSCAKIATSAKTGERCYCRDEVSRSETRHSLNCVNTELPSLPIILNGYHLVEINFAGNKLTKIPMHAFSDAQYLENIFLPHNGINTIENDTLEGLHLLNKIKHLDLSDNNIRTLGPGMFRSLPWTSFLSLARNLIHDIQNDTFADLTINNIDLSGNKLSKLAPGMFSGSHGITQLNLRDNEIVTIETHAFRNLGDLEDLKMSGNRIMKLTARIFEGSFRLSVIDLSRNYFTILSNEIFPEGLEELSLSENIIWQIEPVTFQRLHKMKYLNLSGNPLHDVHPDLFRFNPDILILSADDIRVCCTTQQMRPCKWKGNGTCEQPRPQLEVHSKDQFGATNIAVPLEVIAGIIVVIIITAVTTYILKKN